jgi:hypothetical protein
VSRRRRRSPLLLVAAVTAALAGGVGVGWATTAGNTMPSTNRASVTTLAVTASEFKPAACTGAVTSVVDVPAGGGVFSPASGGTLILATSGNDDVRPTGTGYVCFVGGGPVANNTDAYRGGATSSQCVLAASVRISGIKNCTIVQSSP